MNEPTMPPQGADDHENPCISGADGPNAQEATLGQSVVAPANDDHTDPAAVNPASSPAEPPAAGDQPDMFDARLPPGLCAKCGANVQRPEITVKNGTPLHGTPRATCGPVLTHWLYHIAFVAQGKNGVAFEESEETLPMPIEAGNAREVLRRVLAARIPTDPMAIGAKPKITLLTWTLLAQA